MSFGRGMYERNFQRLVEDYLASIESANSFGRLLPAREVVDLLGHCRRHNFDRRDEALLGQVRLARGRLDRRWLEVAAREARAINMWDHEWIRNQIFNPDSRLQSRRSSRRESREARAINMWDHEWIRNHIFNPDSRLQSRRSSRRESREARAINMRDHEGIRNHIFNPDSRLQSRRSSRRERSEDQARPSSSTRSPVRFPQPGGRVVPPSVARSPSPMVASPTLSEEDALLHEDPADMIMLSEPSRPSFNTGHGTTSSQPSVVSTSQGTTSSQPSVVSTSQDTASRPSVVSTSQGTTSSRPSVARTSQGTTSSRPSVRTARGTSSSLSSDGRRCRRDRRNVSGNNGPEKKPKFEMVVVPRERQMTVEIPILGSSRPAVSSGSKGAQCPIYDCSGDGSKRHAFECHLPAIFREELHGQEITRRRIGALSMIASWLLGDRATLRSLANYFHLMDAGTTFDQSVSQGQRRAMSDLCISIGTDPPSSFVLSHAGNEEWVLVHWQVLLRLLARVQPLARLQPLRELFPLSPEEEAQLPRPPLAFDSHCHIDRIRTVCHLARSASIQEICSQERPDDDHVVSLEGLVTSYCDPETYPTPDEVRAIVSQGCYVVVGLHPKKEASERDWETLHDLLQLPEVSGLGEIGVDHTMPISTWTDQTNKIDRAIRAADNLPRIVVLHCRGVQNEDNTEAYNLLLKTLSLRLGCGALIHLHCFSGSSRIVDMWLETFPNTYFSFTKMVGSFTGDCARAVRKLHVGRLLIETDAPYVHFRGSRHSTPAVIGMTAAELGRIRGVDWKAILEITRANAKRLYGERRGPDVD